jgi:hypothetical protein
MQAVALSKAVVKVDKALRQMVVARLLMAAHRIRAPSTPCHRRPEHLLISIARPNWHNAKLYRARQQ